MSLLKVTSTSVELIVFALSIAGNMDELEEFSEESLEEQPLIAINIIIHTYILFVMPHLFFRNFTFP
jgi:hypothetical protein